MKNLKNIISIVLLCLWIVSFSLDIGSTIVGFSQGRNETSPIVTCIMKKFGTNMTTSLTIDIISELGIIILVNYLLQRKVLMRIQVAPVEWKYAVVYMILLCIITILFLAHFRGFGCNLGIFQCPIPHI
jgi:hypothetical protein